MSSRNFKDLLKISLKDLHLVMPGKKVRLSQVDCDGGVRSGQNIWKRMKTRSMPHQPITPHGM